MEEEILVTEENINEIKKRLEILYDKFRLDRSEDEILIGNHAINILFPYEQESIEYSISEFFLYTGDLDSIVKVNNSTVRSSKVVQTIVNSNNNYIFDNLNLTNNIVETDRYTMSIINNPFLIGLIAASEGPFSEGYGIAPCSIYTAVEIIYKDESDLLDPLNENKLIKEFLFYLSYKYNYYIYIDDYINIDEIDYEYSLYVDDDSDIDSSENIKISSDHLLKYSSIMDMYIEAMSIGNTEIKFLYYYKIIEYCSPIVSKMRAYELLNRKLDLLSHSNRDFSYLDSIFELVREHDISLRDNELVYTVLLECIDIIQLYEFLPSNIRKRLSKKYQYKQDSIKYGLDISVQNQIKQGVSTVLYATRNRIVHAKSNYTFTGEECASDDLEDLNLFISKLCYCLIAWNNRQSVLFRIQ